MTLTTFERPRIVVVMLCSDAQQSHHFCSGVTSKVGKTSMVVKWSDEEINDSTGNISKVIKVTIIVELS